MNAFEHVFAVDAPVEAVAAFHHQAGNVAAITPPPIVVRVDSPAPDRMRSGDEMAFTMWLGPLPLRWHVRFDEVSPTGFVDRQLAGPFAFWRHTHRFVAEGARRTRVEDRVEAGLRPEWPWRLIGGAMWLGLPLLFKYRAWRTRRLLARPRNKEAAT